MHILYMSIRSPFARRVRILLEELQIPYESRVLDVFKPDPSYFAINPFSRVPSLELPDGTVISDSNQIQFYLHEKYSYHPLFLSNALRVEKARHFSALAAGVMEYTVAFFLESLRPKALQDEDVLEETLSGVARTLDYFEQILSGNQSSFLSGEAIGFCDVDIGTAYGYARLRLSQHWGKTFPRLNRYYESLMLRNSFAKTQPPA